jgi:hypothetical protein
MSVSAIPEGDLRIVFGGSASTANIPAGPHGITLSAGPFVAGGSNDFALSTTGGGSTLARLRMAGHVELWWQGYRDTGTSQSATFPSAAISQ